MQRPNSYIQAQAILFRKHLRGEIKFCSYVKASNVLYLNYKKNTKRSLNMNIG